MVLEWEFTESKMSNIGGNCSNQAYDEDQGLLQFGEQLNSNIEGFLDLMTEVDMFFEYMKVPKERKMKFVTYRLKGGASVWWDRLNEMRQREGRNPIATWR
ncbi:conserved hypothetical protein [Ricinus communis]|uniref:Retrotransposon gag domain-containing protein n=1 Tax=Ricinus communis TaxID=3988 RepID=B9S0V5_RICCO|nr:conserved hypothetical protein [Ricinus communis]